MQSSGLFKPRIIDVQSLSPVHARVVMEPFERGYGHTLGNALRRILLSSMPGYAPTEVTIEGVLHEYSTIDGVQEDVVDILLNLKGVVFKLHNREEVVLHLRKEGKGIVRAGDIEVSHDVEIINPEHIIAHLSAGGKLAMEMKVERSRGYVAGNLRELGDGGKSIGRLVLDASFSPVRRVSYAVESARVLDASRLFLWGQLRGPRVCQQSARGGCARRTCVARPVCRAPLATLRVARSIRGISVRNSRRHFETQTADWRRSLCSVTAWAATSRRCTRACARRASHAS